MPGRPDPGLARRLAAVRRAHYGEHGGPLLAMMLRVPFRDWFGYEAGHTRVPDAVLRRVADLTSTCPDWLRTGEGDPDGHLGVLPLDH